MQDNTTSKTVIIIGGGLGGLCTGCLLCKEGYRVTVLERHNKIGGGLHTFKRKDTIYETGMHYIGALQSGGVLQRFFSYLGIFDSLQIKPLGTDTFDVVYVKEDHRKFPIGLGKENFIAHWAEAFPEERENIRKYTEAIYAVADRFPLCNLRVSDHSSLEMFFDESIVMPVADFIAKYIKNPKLQKLLAWNNPLYGGDAYRTPIYVHAIINHLFIEGASRFVGGSQQLADLMSQVILDHGGTIVCDDGVEQLVVKNRKIEYAVTQKGKRYAADTYISSLHPEMTIHLLDDPAQLPKAYRNRLETMSNTYSAFVVFLKMKKETFPYYNHNLYFVEDYDEIWNVGQYKQQEWPVGIMLMTAPKSKQEEKWADTIIVSCLMRYDDVRQWENSTRGKRPQEYLDFKKNHEKKVLDKLKYYFPDIENQLESVFSASPLTIKDYTGSKDGSLYGYTKDYQRLECAHVSPSTKISNLFLTGQNINLHGILGVPLNAIITVGVITGKYNEIIRKIDDSKENVYVTIEKK